MIKFPKKSMTTLSIIILLGVACLFLIPFISLVKAPSIKNSINVSIANKNINFQYADWEVSYAPYFIMDNGQRYKVEDIPPSININLWKKQIKYNKVKYGVNFSNVPATIKNNLKYVVLHRTKAVNINLADVKKVERCVIMKGKAKLCYDDLLSTYQIPIINQTDVVISVKDWSRNICDEYELSHNKTVCDEWEGEKCVLSHNETIYEEKCVLSHTETITNWIDNGDGTWKINFDPIYEIIEISNAEHLNESRDFISNIYNETYKLDNIWSEEIPSEHYVRVTFIQNLTSINDITIYPHIVSNNPKLQIYEKDKNDIITEIILVSDKYNRAYLTDLIGSQHTFDLKIIDGSVEIDHIIDPPLLNNWKCKGATTRNFKNITCWSQGRVPIAGDDVVFNATGNAPCNITNNSMPQNLNSFTVKGNYSRTIYFDRLFAKGNWSGNAKLFNGTQIWNVTGNITINNGTMKIYGDYPKNITADGHGQEWRSLQGNVSVGKRARLNGVGLGFAAGVGPGYDTTAGGGTYGGRGGSNTKDPYGNASAPISLGSGGSSSAGSAGGSGIKLQGDLVRIDGSINISSLTSDRPGSGGSIWIKANNISGTGTIKADAGVAGGRGGGGGRTRLEYGTALEFTGSISVAGATGTTTSGIPGTLTFTNNTWPGNWNLTGNIGLLGGDYGEPLSTNTTNVLGNFNTNGYTMTIYGDCFYDSTSSPSTCWNKTADGRGVWINASGNITISSGSVLDGSGLGFPAQVGPGASTETNKGATYGGRGGDNTKATYGSETEPVSLGSGAYDVSTSGGSAIKLQSDNGFTKIDGLIKMDGTLVWGKYGPSGGSIWLQSNNISGSGNLSAGGGSDGTKDGGGGGRISLTSSNVVEFFGVINNYGGNTDDTSSYTDGSGGTVYINATNSITSKMNISVVGYNGSMNGNPSKNNWGQRINITAPLITLTGVLNASKTTSATTTKDGNITLNFTNCASSYSSAKFDPAPNIETGCTGDTIPPYFTDSTPKNQTVAWGVSFHHDINASDAVSFKGFAVNSTRFTINASGWLKNNSLLGARQYWLNISINDTQDNVNSTLMYVNVSKATGSNVSLTFDIATPQTYPTPITPTCTIITGVGTPLIVAMSPANPYTILPSGVADVLGVETWTINCTLPATENYTMNVTVKAFQILKNTTYKLNISVAPGYIVTYGTATTVTGNWCPAELNCKLYRNNVQKTSPEITTLPASLGWIYKFNATDNGNYSNQGTQSFPVTVNQEGGEVHTFLNNSRANITIWNGTKIWINGTLINGTKNITMWVTGGLNIPHRWNFGTSPIKNFTNFTDSEGKNKLWNITVIYPGGQNYTRDAETWWINVTYKTIADTINPDINITFPINNTNSSNIHLDINYTRADDVDLFNCWYSNDSMTKNTSLATCQNITSIVWKQGKHNVSIWANDTSGNKNFSRVSFTIDTTAPLLNIVFPANNTNSSNNKLDVNYTRSDALTSISCFYSNDSMSANTTLASCSNITAVTWTEGRHNVTIGVNDSAGNIAFDRITFTIDTINPSLILFSPANNSNFSRKNVDFVANASDNGRLYKYWLRAFWTGGVETQEITANLNGVKNETLNRTINFVNEGYHFWNYTVQDSAGNYNRSKRRILTIDLTAPVLAIITPANNTNSSNNKLDVNFTRSDALTAVRSCWYSNDTFLKNTSLANCGNITAVTWTEGKHNVTIWANDSVGNIARRKIVFTIDTTAPLFSNLINHTMYANTSFIYDLDAIDKTGISNFTFNNTNYFNITIVGVIRNNTKTTNVTIRWLKVNVTDVLNNKRTSTFWINMTLGITFNLTIWDDTNDVQGENSIHHAIEDEIGFYANFTNSSADVPSTANGTCKFKTNFSLGIWSTLTNMTYKPSTKLFTYKEIFTKSGTFYFNVTCTYDGDNYSKINRFRIDLIPTGLTGGSGSLFMQSEITRNITKEEEKEQPKEQTFLQKYSNKIFYAFIIFSVILLIYRTRRLEKWQKRKEEKKRYVSA